MTKLASLSVNPKELKTCTFKINAAPSLVETKELKSFIVVIQTHLSVVCGVLSQIQADTSSPNSFMVVVKLELSKLLQQSSPKIGSPVILST